MKNSLLLLLAAAAALSACADDPIFTARSALHAQNQTIGAAAARGEPRAPVFGRVTTSPDIFLGDEVIDLGRGMPMPNVTATIELTFRDAVPVSAVARAIGEQVGYPVSSVVDDTPRPMGRLSGDLPSVLALLKTRYGITAEHRDGQILLIPAGVELIALPLPQMPQVQQVGANGGRRRGSGNSQPGAAQSNQKGPASAEGTKALIEALRMISLHVPYPGTSITPLPDLNMVAIKAPAAVMPAVKAIIRERVDAFSTSIRTTVRILAIDLGTDRTFSTNLDYVWGSLLGQPARFSGSNAANALALLRGTPTGIKADTLEASLQSLATRLSIANNQRFDALLRPGFVKTINDSRTITYIRSSTPPGQSGNSTISATTATVEQDEIEVGTRGQVVAMPVSKSRIQLSLSFALSTLLDLRQITSGNVTLQQPDTLNREYNDQVELASGDTIVAMAQLIETARDGGSGLFTADLPLPGSRSAERRYQLQLVLVSAAYETATAPRRDTSSDTILSTGGL